MFNKHLRTFLIWAMILVVVVYVVLPYYHQRSPREEISYSDFLDKARSGDIESVTVGSEDVSGQLRSGQEFRAYVPGGRHLVHRHSRGEAHHHHGGAAVALRAVADHSDDGAAVCC